MCNSNFNRFNKCYHNSHRNCRHYNDFYCECYDNCNVHDFDNYTDTYYMKYNADKRTFEIKTNDVSLLMNTISFLYSFF